MFAPILQIKTQQTLHAFALETIRLYKLWVAISQGNLLCIEQGTDNKSASCAAQTKNSIKTV